MAQLQSVVAGIAQNMGCKPHVRPSRLSVVCHRTEIINRRLTMETLIEKDSPRMALIFLAVLFVLVLAGGLALAYLGGVFTGKDAVKANDLRIANMAHLPSPPLSAPASPKP